MATTSPPLPPIPTVTTIDGVVEAIGSIIDWSISVSSRRGYFAALYKRITIATATAVSQGLKHIDVSQNSASHAEGPFNRGR